MHDRTGIGANIPTMAKPKITIIGLGTTGASMGLALQKEEGSFTIVSHDRDPDAAREATRLGAVQRTEWNLHNACDEADLIILAVPLNELGELFESYFVRTRFSANCLDQPASVHIFLSLFTSRLKK